MANYYLTVRNIKKYVSCDSSKNKILHVGAHDCQEKDDYAKYLGVADEDIFWVEGNPAVYKKNKNKVKNIYCEIISDENKPVTFNVTNNEQSSSILELDKHTVYHPEVVNISSFNTVSKSITQLCEENKEIKFNFLALDIQGAELLALKGISDSIFSGIEYILTEINTEELYKGCPLFDEIKSFLDNKGFELADYKLTPWQWGDAFFVRKNRKMVYCRPIGGFNDQLCVIDRCYEWCMKNNRVMILDTVHPECCYNVCYEEFFEDLPAGIISVLSIKPELRASLQNICTMTTSSGQKDCKTLLPSFFDLEKENEEEIAVYINFGGGKNGYNFFKKLSFKQDFLQHFNKIYSSIPKPYISIQVRNTDLKSDKNYQEEIAIEDSIQNIHVATDDRSVVEYYASKKNVYNFTTFGNSSSAIGLHYCKNISGKTQFTELLTDLLLMKYSKEIKSVSKGGYIELARLLWIETSKQYNSITISVGTLKGVDIQQLIDSYKAVDKTKNCIIVTTWQEDLTPEIVQLFEQNSIIVISGTEEEFLKKCNSVRNSINLQLFTIKNAIDYIKKNELYCNFIIKTRNDLYGVGYEKIFDYLDIRLVECPKISVLSFFANPVEKLYYMDHFVAGPSTEMIKFYDINYCPYQHFYPEHYLLVNYIQSNNFRLNHIEYKKIFNFVAADFEKLGIDFVWDRTGRVSQSEVNAENSRQLLIKDNVCMYRELIEYNRYNFNVLTINFEPTFKNQYYDCYFGVRKNEDFAFELSFAKSGSVRMFLVSDNDTVDLQHPKIYWIKKDFTFIDKSLIKVFLRDYQSVFLRIQSIEDYKLFSPFLCNGNIKQLTLSNMGDSFYETNHYLCSQLSYKLVYQDFNKKYFVYLRF